MGRIELEHVHFGIRRLQRSTHGPRHKTASQPVTTRRSIDPELVVECSRMRRRLKSALRSCSSLWSVWCMKSASRAPDGTGLRGWSGDRIREYQYVKVRPVGCTLHECHLFPIGRYGGRSANLTASLRHSVIGEGVPGIAGIAGRTGSRVQLVDAHQIGLRSGVHRQTKYDVIASAILRRDVEPEFRGKFRARHKPVLAGNGPVHMHDPLQWAPSPIPLVSVPSLATSRMTRLYT